MIPTPVPNYWLRALRTDPSLSVNPATGIIDKKVASKDGHLFKFILRWVPISCPISVDGLFGCERARSMVVG